MPDFYLEHLHPGWFGRRKYRTLAGIYESVAAAQAAVDTRGATWDPYVLKIGKYTYPLGLECYPFGRNSAWWRISADEGCHDSQATFTP